MKHLYFIGLLSLTPILCVAQRSAKNIYLELGGPGFFSANYDMRLSKSNDGLGVRVGVGIISDLQASGITLPVGLNYILGNRKNFLEIGGGASYVNLPGVNQDQPFNFPGESFVVGYGWLGYKHQPADKGFTFRAGFCQYLRDLNLPTILGVPNLYPALSFGYSFQ
jgi:hypothetical protein